LLERAIVEESSSVAEGRSVRGARDERRDGGAGTRAGQAGGREELRRRMERGGDFERNLIATLEAGRSPKKPKYSCNR
jgi:hypothetical protein